jgi:hypothetical protein
MASSPTNAPCVPEDSANNPTSLNPKNTPQNTPNKTASGPKPSMEQRLKAFLDTQKAEMLSKDKGGVGPTQDSRAIHPEGQTAKGKPYDGPNPGGPLSLADIPGGRRPVPCPPTKMVDARNEQTPTGGESGDTQDITSQSGSFSEPQTGTK